MFSRLGFCVSRTARMSTLPRRVVQFTHMQLERKLILVQEFCNIVFRLSHYVIFFFNGPFESLKTNK